MSWAVSDMPAVAMALVSTLVCVDLRSLKKRSPQL